MKKDNLTYTFLTLRDKLHRSALGFLKNDEDARDALQDAFCNLWKAGGIQSDAEARNKLFAVLRNLCIDRLRKPRHLPLTDTHENAMMVEPYSENIADLVQHLSRGLSPTQLRIYSLIVDDGLEYEEIALKLKMTVEAVRMNMSRARKKIRENYKLFEK